MNKKNMPALFGALALLGAAPASAALYRCGNVFQDRPCDAVVEAAHQPASAPRRAASAAAQEAAHAAHEAASAAVAPPHEDPPRPAASAAVAARKGPPSLACGNLREQHKAVEARLKAGGRPETIHMYERQLREVERSLDEGNCR